MTDTNTGTDALAWWQAALDDLETEIDRAERALVAIGEHDGGEEAGLPWLPPAAPAELPPALSARAQELVARQQAILSTLAAARQQAKAQKHVTGRFNSGAAAGSVYVDVSA